MTSGGEIKIADLEFLRQSNFSTLTPNELVGLPVLPARALLRHFLFGIEIRRFRPATI